MSSSLTPEKLVQRMLDKVETDHDTTKDIVTELFHIITEELRSTDRISLHGFGTFKRIFVEEHNGRNPHSGEAMVIPAHYRVKFSPASALAERVNVELSHLKPILLADDFEIGEDEEIHEGLLLKAMRYEMNYFDSDDPEAVAEPEFAALAELMTEPEREPGTVLQAVTEFESDQKTDMTPEIIAAAEFDAEPEIGDVSEFRTGSEIGAESEYRAITEFDIEDKKEEEASKKTGITRTVTSGIILLILILLLGWFFFRGRAESKVSTAPVEMMQPEETKELVPESPEEGPETAGDPPETDPAVAAESLEADSSSVSESPQGNAAAEATEPGAIESAAAGLPKSYTISQGDSFSKLARERWNNIHLWPYLYEMNRETYPDPDFIYPGNNILIPSRPDQIRQMDEIESSIMLAYKRYRSLIEEQADSTRNIRRQRNSQKVIAGGEILYPGFMDRHKLNIRPEDIRKSILILEEN